MRCCSGVFGLITTSCICMQVFMPNIATENAWSYLPDINTWHVAAEENCNGKVTTENEQHPQSFGALQLDNGVTGIGNSEQ